MLRISRVGFTFSTSIGKFTLLYCSRGGCRGPTAPQKAARSVGVMFCLILFSAHRLTVGSRTPSRSVPSLHQPADELCARACTSPRPESFLLIHLMTFQRRAPSSKPFANWCRLGLYGALKLRKSSFAS